MTKSISQRLLRDYSRGIWPIRESSHAAVRRYAQMYLMLKIQTNPGGCYLLSEGNAVRKGSESVSYFAWLVSAYPSQIESLVKFIQQVHPVRYRRARGAHFTRRHEHARWWLADVPLRYPSDDRIPIRCRRPAHCEYDLQLITAGLPVGPT